MVKRTAILIALVLGLAVVAIGAEILLARRGDKLDTPDVKNLTRTSQSTAPDQPLRVLWLGDSTAAGVGASGPDGAVSSQVAKRLEATTHSSYQTDVVAVSGARVKNLLQTQLPRVASFKPDIVVISVGANDTIHLTSQDLFRKQYEQLITGLKQANVEPRRIVMIGVPDLGATTRLLEPLRTITGVRGRKLDEIVKDISRRFGTQYVDIFTATSAAFRANPAGLLAADNFHPSDAGYALWADAITPAVARAAAP
ncbi:MAG: hypothetical protein QOJ00_1346 [Actinomycetota bacterium]